MCLILGNELTVSYSKNLIQEYREEIYRSYRALISEEEAQAQLRSLTRSLFSADIAVKRAESREASARRSVTSPPCAGSLSATIIRVGENEVGSSITPTSRHRDKGI